VDIGGQSLNIPIISTLTPASAAKARLAEETIDRVHLPRQGRGSPKKRLERLTADKAYNYGILCK
jgi:hypothetical protein